MGLLLVKERHPMANVVRRKSVTFVLPWMAAVTVLLPGVAVTGDWPHWRGPMHNGSSNDEGPLPVSWSKTKNVEWVTGLPGPGAGTPAVVGGRIFVTSTTGRAGKLVGMCIRRADGKVLWTKVLGVGRRMGRISPAGPSPVTDGERVIFLFGSGNLAALDMEGKLIWSRHLPSEYGKLSIKFGYSASPLLHGGRLYVSIVRSRGTGKLPSGEVVKLDSLLLAVDPASGRTIWAAKRPSSAIAESQESYSSPIPYKTKDSDGIIVGGGDCLTYNDAKTGKELWRFHYTETNRILWRLVPTPVVLDGLICVTIPRGGAMFAVRPPRPGGQPPKRAAWVHGDGPDVCSPLYYKGLLYVLHEEKRTLTCLDPTNGSPIWQKRLDGRVVFRASPVGADGKIYCVDTRGEVWILAAGRTGRLLGKVAMNEEDVLSTMAVADGRIYIRAEHKLYCVRDKSEIRNPKSETNPKLETLNTKQIRNTKPEMLEPNT